jgi:hypothetical protein
MISVIGDRKLCKKARQRSRIRVFGEGGEVANVPEQDRHRPQLSAQLQALRTGRQLGYHLRREILTEGPADAVTVAIDDPIAEQQHCRCGGRQCSRWCDERLPHILRESQLSASATSGQATPREAAAARIESEGRKSPSNGVRRNRSAARHHDHK